MAADGVSCEQVFMKLRMMDGEKISDFFSQCGVFSVGYATIEGEHMYGMVAGHNKKAVGEFLLHIANEFEESPIAVPIATQFSLCHTIFANGVRGVGHDGVNAVSI